MAKEKHFSFLKFFLIFFLIIGLIMAYGFLIEPKLITVKEQKITINNWPENFNGFKIVHISDLHFGRVFDEQSLQKLVKSINEQRITAANNRPYQKPFSKNPAFKASQ